MNVAEPLYACDPDLNTECSKTHCYRNALIPNPCRATRNIMFAKKPVESVTLMIPVDNVTAALFDIKLEEKYGTE